MEIEAKFLEIDVSTIKKKLKDLGAHWEYDTVFREAIFQGEGKRQDEWEKTFKRVRIRDQGDKIYMTLKEQIGAKFEIDSTHEVELLIDDFDKAVQFLLDCDLMKIRDQEKRRIHYDLDGVDVDIDYWPGVPAFLEIEASSKEKVKDAAGKLGLDWSKAVFLDARQVFKKYYNFEVMDLKEFKFNGKNSV